MFIFTITAFTITALVYLFSSKKYKPNKNKELSEISKRDVALTMLKQERDDFADLVSIVVMGVNSINKNREHSLEWELDFCASILRNVANIKNARVLVSKETFYHAANILRANISDIEQYYLEKEVFDGDHISQETIYGCFDGNISDLLRVFKSIVKRNTISRQTGSVYLRAANE